MKNIDLSRQLRGITETLARIVIHRVEWLLLTSDADPDRHQLSFYREEQMYAVTPKDSNLTIQEAERHPHFYVRDLIAGA